MKKVLGLTLALMLAVPLAASAAVIGNLTINPTTVNQAGTLSVSGSCGTIGANGNVSFQLNNKGAITNVGPTVTSNSAGSFSATLTIPSNFATGVSTIQAVCPNGDIVTSALTVNSPIGNTLVLSGVPTLNQTLGISGSCGSVAAGSQVILTFNRSIGSTSIGTTTTTGTNGDFSGNFTVPASAGGGPVQIVAQCPNGTIVQNTSIVDPSASLTVQNATVQAGGTVNVSGTCGNMSGRPVTVTLSNPNRQISLGTTLTTSNGNFASSFSIPSGFPTGNALIVAFCPTGNLVTAALTVSAASSSTPGGTSSGTTNGTVSGTGTSTTPSGGVAAGSGASIALIIALALVASGIAGLVLSKKSANYSNEV